MIKRLFLIAACMFFVHALPAVGQDTPENANFKLAIKLLNDGLYTQAEDQFRSIIDRYPNTANAVESRFRLAELLKRRKSLAEARGLFQEFALQHQDHQRAPDAWWHVGEIYAEEHNYAEAGQAFARLKTFYPKSAKAPAALLKASRYFLKAADFENARTVLNAILIEYAQSDVRLEAQSELGQLYLATGEYERALREFSRLLTEAISTTMRADVIVSIGETHALLGNRTEAEARYREVTGTYPESAAAQKALIKLGDLQRQFRDYSTARGNYETVANNSKAPADLRRLAFIGLAETAIAQKNYSDAENAYQRLFRDTGEKTVEPQVYRKAAEAARRAGSFAQAERWLDHLYADTLIVTDRRVLLVDMAEIAREGKNFTSALARYRSYLQRYPDDPGAPFAQLRIAEIEEQEFRNNSSALQQYAAVNERYGVTRVSDDALAGSARTLQAQEKYEEAAETWYQVLMQYPASDLYEHAEEQYRLLTEIGGGDHERAVEQLTELVTMRIDNAPVASVNVLLGRIYLEDLRDFERAEQRFDAAVNGGVSGSEAEEAGYGAALAVVRLAQKGKRTTADAEKRCMSFFTAYPESERRDDLGWALFRLQSAAGNATARLDAATAFLARNPARHREEALLVYGHALAALGRLDDAEKEFTTVIETSAAGALIAEACYERAMVRAAGKKFEAALADLQTCHDRAPNGRQAAAALLQSGRLLTRVGRYSVAISACNRCVSEYAYSALADSARIQLLTALSESGAHNNAVVASRNYLEQVESNPFLGEEHTQQYLFSHAFVLALARLRSDAKIALLRYTTEYPSGTHIGEVYYALGQMYRDEGKIDLATAYLQQSADFRQGSEALLAAADLLLESGRYSRAVDSYRRVEESATSSREKEYAASRIVIALYRDGKLEQAGNEAQAFRSRHPEAEPVFDEFELERGKHFFGQGDYRTAEDIFEDVEDSDTRALEAFGMYWIGRCHEAQSKNADAQEQFDEVIARHPQSEAAVQAMLALARMHMRAERFQQAAQQYQTLVDAGAVSEENLKVALNGLIRCYDKLNMYDAALEMTKRFLDAYPYDQTAFRKRVNLGVFYYQLKYYDTAIEHMENLLGEAPANDQAEIRFTIGEAYFSKGDYTQAALEFLKVPYLVVGKTEIDWTGSAYYMAGQSYEKQAKFSLAIEMYQKIIDTPGIDGFFKTEARKHIERVKALMN